MLQYASCSKIFSVSRAVTDEELSLLDGRIITFMATARREVVAHNIGNITPKLHLLEEHVLSCMQRFHVGLGLLGEQGGEGIHHELNQLNIAFSNIRKDVKRLKTIVAQHCVATLPQYHQHVPATRKRKK